MNRSAAIKSVTFTTTPDQEWLDFVRSSSPDIFMRGYSGYWARGVAHAKHRGWLVFEHGSDDTYTDEEKRHAIHCWRNDKPLPKLWHRFDTDLAYRAWCEGVRAHGEDWYRLGDAPRSDLAIQKALFEGKVRYA